MSTNAMDTSPASATPELFKVYEQPKLEHVLDLVVTCSGPLTFGPSSKSKEGVFLTEMKLNQ